MAAKRLGCYVTVMLLLNMECQGQQCTRGFIFPVFRCCDDRGQDDPVTRIIPDMNFTCNGAIIHWRAAGRFRNRQNTINPVLSIWRERISAPGTYDRIDTGIELGRCGDEEQVPSVIGMSNVYECNLTQSDWAIVQPGDVIGIELPTRKAARFRLNFDDNNGGPINYEFQGHISTVNMSQASFTTQDQPQISLTVEPIVVTTVPVILSTTQPLTTTEASTPDVTITQSPTATAEASSTDLTTTQPLTTTEVSSTDLPTIQPLTTTEALSTAVTHPSITTTVAQTIQTSSTSTTQSLLLVETTTQSLTTMSDPNSVIMNLGQSNSDIGLIIGSAIGGMVGIILLSVLFAILILLVVYQSRKHKRHLGERETRINMAQYDNTINTVIEMKANDSYIPVLSQISTEDNVAYGEIVNQDNNNINLYEIVDQSIAANTAHLTQKEHNKESTTEYDYVYNDYV